MRPSEQQGLLLRQLVALRRRGLEQDAALALIEAGLTRGALASAVQRTRRVLASGTAPGASDTALVRLLADESTSIEALEQAAHALHCQLATEDALSMTRRYGFLLGVGPVVVGSLVCWILPDVSTWMVAVSGLTEVMIALGRYLGPVLAVGGVIGLNRLTTAHGVGGRAFEQAALLLRRVAADGDPIDVLTQPVMRDYFIARRGRVGAHRAAAELAAELMAEGEEAQRVFRQIAPVVAAGVALFCLVPVGVVFWMQLLAMTGGIG